MGWKLWARIAGALVLTLAGVAVAAYPDATDVRYASSQQTMRLRVGPERQALPKGAVARLVIPRIALDAFVLEGTTAEVLERGPGHYPDTPLPGMPGNSAIAGHRTMFGHPFRRLDALAVGDAIHAYTSETATTYRVTSVKQVPPTDVAVVEDTLDDRLTLTTCNPVGSAKQRLVVVAARER